MNKIKIHSGLAAIILLATLFAGWEALLLVTLLMFVFCEVEDSIKNVATRVITFYVGYTIVSMGWNIIDSGVSVVMNGLNSIVSIINTVFEPDELINISKITVSVNGIFGILDSVVSLLLTIAKFAFIISVLTGKKSTGNIVSNKINEYVAKAINFVNAFGAQQTQAASSNTNAQ